GVVGEVNLVLIFAIGRLRRTILDLELTGRTDISGAIAIGKGKGRRIILTQSNDHARYVEADADVIGLAQGLGFSIGTRELNFPAVTIIVEAVRNIFRGGLVVKVTRGDAEGAVAATTRSLKAVTSRPG